MLSSQVKALIKQVAFLMASQSQPLQAQVIQTQSIHPSPVTPRVAIACSLCGSVSHREDTCLVEAHFASPLEDVNYLGNIYNSD